MFARLQTSIPRGMDFHCDLWRFDLLDFPSVRDAAVLAGMYAQLIGISANADNGLPIAVRQWLEQSLEGRLPGSAALVAMLHSERGTPLAASPAHVVLEAIAQRCSVDFLGQSLLEIDSPQAVLPAFPDPSAQVQTVGRQTFQRRPRPARWGINE